MLSREEILGLDDLVREPVVIPEWKNETLFVRVMSGTERDLFEAEMLRDPEADPATRMQNLRARLAVLTVCDAEGKSLFFLSDVEALGKKSSRALDRIFEVARRLNALTPEEVDTLAKNSNDVPNGAPGSASPAP